MASRRSSRKGVPDIELWYRVAESVTPLHKRAISSTAIPPEQLPKEQVQPPQPPAPPAKGNKLKTAAPVPPRAAPIPQRKPTPPLSGIDRRTGQRLLRGQIAIDARIDLHGESVETARVRLFAYLSTAFDRGHRFVIVITGKGAAPFSRHTLHGFDLYDTPERGGRIRRSVPEWFAEPHFRRIVSGFQPAHPRHGGGGALYVRLRKNPDLDR